LKEWEDKLYRREKSILKVEKELSEHAASMQQAIQKELEKQQARLEKVNRILVIFICHFRSIDR